MRSIYRYAHVALLCVVAALPARELVASPIETVGKACWKQLSNGNANAAVDVAAAAAMIKNDTIKGIENFESGMNMWQEDGASFDACGRIVEGATTVGEIAVVATDAGAAGLIVVSQAAGASSGAALGGSVLSFTTPLGLAFLGGMGLSACVGGVSDLDAQYSLKCMEKEHSRLNDDGLDCGWFDRQIASKKRTLVNLPHDGSARKIIEDGIRDLEKRKADCKASREVIRDALSVGDCHGPGMNSEFMVTRCESIRALFCSKDPRWERRKNRLKATFPEWGVEYIHCGTPIAQPTPTATMEEQFYLY